MRALVQMKDGRQGGGRKEGRRGWVLRVRKGREGEFETRSPFVSEEHRPAMNRSVNSWREFLFRLFDSCEQDRSKSKLDGQQREKRDQIHDAFLSSRLFLSEAMLNSIRLLMFGVSN